MKLALELTTESQKLITYPDLFIEGIKIEFVKHINFFGIIIDENLNWNHHIDAVSKKKNLKNIRNHVKTKTFLT
jgi:hypothetical protein